MNTVPSLSWDSRSVPRVEDGVLLRGAARFIDDIVLPGMLHACFVRSPMAHARLRGIDASRARAIDGVHAVLAYADLRPQMTGDRVPAALASGMIKFHVDPPWLVNDEACYVGEPIAIVIADSRRLAEDAARLVELDLESLPAVVDARLGLLAESPKARLDCPNNRVGHTVVQYGDLDAAFAGAAHCITERFRLHKGGGHSIEPRGVVAHYDATLDHFTVWDSTQAPHRVKVLLCALYGLFEHQVRCIAPDVGGGFGPKAVIHPEEMALPAVARLLGRPVKWIEDRMESFFTTAMERDQEWEVEGAFDADGKLRAIRGKLFHDHGACTPYGMATPFNAVTNLVGPYILPAYQIEIAWCLTNMAPVAPTRGAGRPQGTFVMERLLDRAAALAGIGRDEIRRRNLIPADRMPYITSIVTRDGLPMTYDSGDYPECQRRALAAAGWRDFPARQAAARRAGRWIGLGLSNYVEGTGRGPFESASVRIGPSGKIVVTTGATAQGQGTKTMLAQLVAGVLGVRPADIHVIDGDTDASPLGFGAFASRQAVTAGNAAFLAARLVADKAKKTVAGLLEVAPEDLDLVDGCVQVKGVPAMKKSLGDIAKILNGAPGFALPKGVTPGLAASSDYEPPAITYTNGCHVAEVEVDIATGNVRLHRYVVVHDCGNMINPMMVEGQVLGGVVHGIGMTLFEWMRYDDAGQPISITYADYLLPTADVVPRVEIHHMESPTPLNPLGVKGAAESGTIGAPSAVVSAIEDALRPLDVRISDLPVTPERLLALIRRAQRR
ncbi:MAG: xanthine dehydrogenase family protein molybdopterin-binding subunit [Burkholderiales bacterium]